MAAFAAAVKIDTFAYLPVQDFGNAYSTFVAQNYGVKDYGRIKRNEGSLCDQYCIQYHYFHSGVHVCSISDGDFCEGTGDGGHRGGVQYLRIEGSFYCGIGCLFLLYGYYRAINKAQMSVVLTVISLGCVLCWPYILSVPLKASGIWVAIVNHKNLKRNLIRRQKIPCYNEPVRM